MGAALYGFMPVGFTILEGLVWTSDLCKYVYEEVHGLGVCFPFRAASPDLCPAGGAGPTERGRRGRGRWWRKGQQQQQRWQRGWRGHWWKQGQRKRVSQWVEWGWEGQQQGGGWVCQGWCAWVIDDVEYVQQLDVGGSWEKVWPGACCDVPGILEREE